MVAYVAVTQALLPQIRGAGGRVVFLSSIGGRVALPLNGAYHAAKFATEAVGDAFRRELAPWGIRVAIVEPGSIDTPIWSRGERTADELLAASPQTERLYGKPIERLREVVRQTTARAIPPERVAKANRARAGVEAAANALPGRPRREAAGAARDRAADAAARLGDRPELGLR